MRLLRLLPVPILLLLFAAAAPAGLPTVSHEGRDYVELARAADVLKTRLEATSGSTRRFCAPMVTSSP